MSNDDLPPVNPYAAPREAAEPVERELSRDAALRELARPAWFQLGISAISMPIGWGMVAYMLSTPRMRPSGPIESALFAALVFALMVVKPAAAVFSSWRVLKGAIYPWAWIAIVAGLIPFGTACALVELVFAFWLLHILLKPKIRTALSMPAAPLP
jgi:hypothetical protein